MIEGIAEYVNISDRVNLLETLCKRVSDTQSNTFGKTPFRSYST